MPTQTAPPPTHTPAAAAQIHQLNFVHGGTKKMLEGIPKDKLCAQPGTCANHALWIVGHLASTDDYFVHEFSGAKMALPEAWHKLFGMNSKPVADASQYPSYEEVSKAFEERRAALIKWFESLTADQLRKPTKEGWTKYAPTLGDVAHFVAWHEGYHCGQLSVVRRGLGLAPTFG